MWTGLSKDEVDHLIAFHRGNRCVHPNAVLVDEWDEVESDPYRLSDQTIHCLKFECPDCGSSFVETE